MPKVLQTRHHLEKYWAFSCEYEALMSHSQKASVGKFTEKFKVGGDCLCHCLKLLINVCGIFIPIQSLDLLKSIERKTSLSFDEVSQFLPPPSPWDQQTSQAIYSLTSEHTAPALSWLPAKPLAGQGKTGNSPVWGRAALLCLLFLQLLLQQVSLEQTCIIHMFWLLKAKQGAQASDSNTSNHKAWEACSWAVQHQQQYGFSGSKCIYLHSSSQGNHIQPVHRQIWARKGKDMKPHAKPRVTSLKAEISVSLRRLMTGW